MAAPLTTAPGCRLSPPDLDDPHAVLDLTGLPQGPAEASMVYCDPSAYYTVGTAPGGGHLVDT